MAANAGAKPRVGFQTRADLAFLAPGPGGSGTTSSLDQRCPHGTLSHHHIDGDNTPGHPNFGDERCNWGVVPMCNDSSGAKTGYWCRCCSDPPCDGIGNNGLGCSASLDDDDCGGGQCDTTSFPVSCVATVPMTGPVQTNDPGHPWAPASHDSFPEVRAMFSDANQADPWDGIRVSSIMASHAICDGVAINQGTVTGESCADTSLPLCSIGVNCTQRRPIYYASSTTQDFDLGHTLPPEQKNVWAYATGGGATTLSCCDVGGVQSSPGWSTTGSGEWAGATVYIRHEDASWASQSVTSNTANTLTLAGSFETAPIEGSQTAGDGQTDGSTVAIEKSGGAIEYGYQISGVAFDLRVQQPCRRFQEAWLWNQVYEYELGDDSYPIFLLVANKPGSWGWYDTRRFGAAGAPCSRGAYWFHFGPWGNVPGMPGCINVSGPFMQLYGPGKYEGAMCDFFVETADQQANGAAARFTDVRYGALDVPQWRDLGYGGAAFCKAMWDHPKFDGDRSTYVGRGQAPFWKQ